MRRILILAALAGLILAGCGKSATSEASTDRPLFAEEFVEAAAVAEPSETVAVVEMPQPRRIVKTGSMNLRVPRLDEARRRVDSLAAAHGAWYAEERYNDGYARELTLTLRVPAGGFDTFIAELEAGRGELLHKSVSARDVGQEYVDLETRLANKRAYLERYRELLRRAGTIEDILEVERHIRPLEEEIESAEGRLRYLDNQTAYGTLELTLSTEQSPAPERDGFWTRTRRAFSWGWHGAETFVIGVLSLWPFLLLGGGLWYAIRRLRRRKSRG